jgi:hypothetical protein
LLYTVITDSRYCEYCTTVCTSTTIRVFTACRAYSANRVLLGSMFFSASRVFIKACNKSL